MLHYFLLFLFCYQASSQAEIYRHKDGDGHWHFSDKPFSKQQVIKPNVPKQVLFGNVSNNRVRIYKYVNTEGVVHLTNSPPNDKYRLVFMGNINPDMKQWKQLGWSIKAHRSEYNSLIQSAAVRFGVDVDLLHAVIKAESAYRSNAISPAGAVGLMQLMPATAKRYGVTDRYDPADNINGGTRYLRDLLEQFKHNTKLAVAAYNAGENAVIKYGNQIPPYPETQKYVERVMQWYQTP